MAEKESRRLMEGETFISTRPRGRSAKLREILGEHGAELIEMPMIGISSATLSDHEKVVLKNTGQFDWIVFTSSNGVARFFEQLKTITGSYKTAYETRIAVIGHDTGSKLRTFGYNANYISSLSTGRAFAKELRELFTGKNPRVLLPVGNLAGKTIEEQLNGVAEVTRINVYNTVMPEKINSEVLKLIGDDKYGMIIFTSNSGFNNFCLAAGNKINIKSLRIACIGSTTAGALEQAGINPLVTATKMNSQGIAEAITGYYRRNKTKINQGKNISNKKFEK